MSRLARHYQVLFVEEPVSQPGPARLESSWQGRHLEVLTPRTPLPARGFDAEQAALLRPLLQQALRQRGLRDPIVWLYTPMALPLAQSLAPSRWVYDCMDELSAFKGAPPELPERERELLACADLVLTGGPALYEAKRRLHPRVHCMPSAVDAEHFSPPALMEQSEALALAERLQGGMPRPRLGFFGVIDERLDIALLAGVADARPDWQIVMVGPVVKIDPGTLPRRPNIHWLGMCAYRDLPALMAGWDICLMPFALNESTRFISPTKTLEYLAGEKPVVSTPVPDVVLLYGAVVRIAAGVDAFVAACEQQLAETPAQRKLRLLQTMDVVASYSWHRSAQTVHELLQSMPARRPAATRLPAPSAVPDEGRSAPVVEGAAALGLPAPRLRAS